MQTSAFRSRRPPETRTFPASGTSIRCTARVSRRPADFRSLEMQSDAKASVAQPLTIDNPSLYAQITRRGTDHQRFIRVHLPLGNDAQATRTDVLSDRTLRGRRFPEPGNLHRHSQWGSSFTSSGPRRHVVPSLAKLFLFAPARRCKFFGELRFLSPGHPANDLMSPLGWTNGKKLAVPWR